MVYIQHVDIITRCFCLYDYDRNRLSYMGSSMSLRDENGLNLYGLLPYKNLRRAIMSRLHRMYYSCIPPEAILQFVIKEQCIANLVVELHFPANWPAHHDKLDMKSKIALLKWLK